MDKRPKERKLKRYKIWTGPLRLLPDFIIIGGQKCGTTTLYDNVVKHPMVGKSYRKEVHYFNHNFKRGLNWYRANFPTVFSKIWRKGFLRQPYKVGEATPYYIFHPLAAQRAHNLVPNAKLILLLRNPVDRAYSHYQMEVRRGNEDLPTFEEALEKEEARLANYEAELKKDPLYYCFSHHHHAYKGRGRFAEQLAVWDKYYPREQMLILTSSELSAKPTETYNRLFEFTGLPHFDLGELKRSNVGKYDKMKPETRQYLVDYFRPHNQRLYEMVGRDLGWDK